MGRYKVNLREFFEYKFTKSHPDVRRRGLIYKVAYYAVPFVRDRFFEKWIRTPGKALDLGCGGGRDVLAERTQCVGIDLSTTALKNAAHFYNSVVCADVNFLPFRDQSSDLVVSSDVLGHIPNSVKRDIQSDAQNDNALY